MHDDIVEFAVKTFLREVRERLEEAAGVARAAEARAEAGRTDKAVEIAGDIDDLLHDADKLVAMAAVIMRLAKKGESANG